MSTTERCYHCGKEPESDGDHSCPCPHSDETCPDHLAPYQTCASCGLTAVPTPWRDFYTCAPDVWPHEDEQLCESCFRREVGRVLSERKP